MHKCLYVLIPSSMDVVHGVTRALEPFDENLAVRPYKMHMTAGTVAAMADYYKIPKSELKRLAKKLHDWTGSPGGVDRLGLYVRSTYNPDGKWDWYTIAGRWDGYIIGDQRPLKFGDAVCVERNTLLASQLSSLPGFADRLPDAVLTPIGDWIERSTVVISANEWHVREASESSWQKRIRRILRAFADHRVVCVDIHC